MKKTLPFLFGLFISAFTFAQVPQQCPTGINDENTPVVTPLNSIPGGGQVNFNPGTDAMTAWVLPSTGSTSGNSRIPRNSIRYQREEYLILQSEMAAGGFPSGYDINALGFLIAAAGIGTQ